MKILCLNKKNSGFTNNHKHKFVAMSLMGKNPYWARVVKDMEQKAQQQSKKNKIKKYDFAVTLPENLRKRVAKIQPYEFDEFDKNIFINEFVAAVPKVFQENQEEAVRKSPQATEDFSERTGSGNERKELDQPRFALNIDKPLEHKAKKKAKHNWCSAYICRERKERVKWDSKMYDMEHSIWEKTLDEQAEHLMDASAERFTEWLNSLGSSQDSNISKEKLKALFAIEGDRQRLASVTIEPNEVNAIPMAEADKWHLPEMANELKYEGENYVEKRLKKVPKKIVTVAFGRTVPVKDRTWMPEACSEPIKSVYPEELLTYEKLFKGITHLRSTKELVEFYKQRPDLEKPRYLVKCGLFKEKEKAQTVAHVPLYERLKLKY